MRHLRRHERLHGHRHLLRVLAFWECGRHDLVDKLAAVFVFFRQHRCPEIGVHTLDDISRLNLEHTVSVRAIHQLCVAVATLVRDARQVRIALLAVATDDGGLVVLVREQKVLWVLVAVDEHLTHSVVYLRIHTTFVHEVLEELREDLQTVTFLHFFHERRHGQERSHGQDESLDEIVRALEIQQCTNDLRRLLRVDFLHVAFDVAQHVVVVKVCRQIRNELITVAHIDKRTSI